MYNNVYPNLLAEIARKGLSIAEASRAIGISRNTLYFKMGGKSEFTLDEAVKIKDMLQIDLPLEVLFERR